MIKHCYIQAQKQKIEISKEIIQNKLPLTIPKNWSSFDIYIEFTEVIKEVKNHDYNWIPLQKETILYEYCPKIIRLNSGVLVQSNINQGYWIFSKQNPKTLIWRFQPASSKQITQYNALHQKQLIDTYIEKPFCTTPSLLFTTQYALEISRSKIPFTGMICFTDHCDFDTLQNLELLRTFLKKHNITTTKGFFLNHFSKRNDNASFEYHREELIQWIQNGHELCYHSLSQSIKSNQESKQDFLSFKAPLNDINVWIDHGYQPYNLSLYETSGYTNNEFLQVIDQNKIDVFWNYIDSGIATNGVINQLNAHHFTLDAFQKSVANTHFKSKIALLFKSVLFHYDNSPKHIRNYINFKMNWNSFTKTKKPKFLFRFIKNVIPVFGVVFKTAIFWSSIKKQVYKSAKYAPIIFKHTIKNKQITIFQTLEMVDFKKSLSPENIDTLVLEKGVCVAHTYFSDNMKHHSGRIILDNGKINSDVETNFEYLAKKIKNSEIWNPTLSEVVSYWKQIDEAVFDVDASGKIFLSTTHNLNTREVY